MDAPVAPTQPSRPRPPKPPQPPKPSHHCGRLTCLSCEGCRACPCVSCARVRDLCAPPDDHLGESYDGEDGDVHDLAAHPVAPWDDTDALLASACREVRS